MMMLDFLTSQSCNKATAYLFTYRVAPPGAELREPFLRFKIALILHDLEVKKSHTCSRVEFGSP